MSDTLHEQLGGKLPTIHLDRCLNARHKAAHCTRCVGACPVNAIQLVAEQPLLDGGQCIGCGICLQTCPTEVFDQASSPEATLMQVGAQLPPQPLALICPRHSTPDTTPAPVTLIVRHRRRLAALAPTDLLQLSQLGTRPLWLDDSECAACPIGQAQATLRHSVHSAHTLLDAYGESSDIRLFSEHAVALAQPSQRRPLIEGSQPKLSRRGLLTQLRKRAVENVVSRAQPELGIPAAQTVPVQQRLPQRVPAARIRLLELLAPRTPEAEQALSVGDVPFADVQVAAARCSGCALCARFCPTRALDFTTADNTFQLEFQPAFVTG